MYYVINFGVKQLWELIPKRNRTVSHVITYTKWASLMYASKEFFHDNDVTVHAQ